MPWYRLLGACLILCSGVWGARRLNREDARAVEELEAWQELIRYVGTQIACFSLPIGAILARASPSILAACGWHSDGRPRDLAALLSVCVPSDAEGRAILEDFCEAFGRRYRDEELRECEAVQAMLGARIDRLRACLPTKRRLCSTLCVTGALAAVILLI